MYDTLEIRWILDGPLPRHVVEWFAGAEPYDRTDRYLALGPGPGLGVKVRGGSTLEIKALAADQGSRRFDGAVGRIEAWSKWFVDVDPRWPETGLDANWAPVRKTRRLRRFITTDPPQGPAAVAEVPAGREAPAACDAELTELSAFGATYWTLGFEAFGPKEARAVTLPAAVDEVLPGLPQGLVLDLDRSLSYPAWIAARARPDDSGGG
jgi:hypothetical protein